MPIFFEMENHPDHIACVAFGEYDEFSSRELIDSVFNACLASGQTSALLDVNRIKTEVSATAKSIWALNTEESMERFVLHAGFPPRVAIFGSAPLITDHKPATEYFERRDISIRVFDSEEKARAWLLREPEE